MWDEQGTCIILRIVQELYYFEDQRSTFFSQVVMTYFPTLPYTAYYMQEGAKKSSLRQSVCFLPVTGPHINLDEKKMPPIPMARTPHFWSPSSNGHSVKLTRFIFTFLFLFTNIQMFTRFHSHGAPKESLWHTPWSTEISL